MLLLFCFFLILMSKDNDAIIVGLNDKFNVIAGSAKICNDYSCTDEICNSNASYVAFVPICNFLNCIKLPTLRKTAMTLFAYPIDDNTTRTVCSNMGECFTKACYIYNDVPSAYWVIFRGICL